VLLLHCFILNLILDPLLFSFFIRISWIIATLFHQLKLFFSAKKVCKKALETAARSVATDCPSSVLYVPKNPKLALLRQMGFLNGTPFSSVGTVDVSKRRKQ